MAVGSGSWNFGRSLEEDLEGEGVQNSAAGAVKVEVYRSHLEEGACWEAVAGSTVRHWMLQHPSLFALLSALFGPMPMAREEREVCFPISKVWGAHLQEVFATRSNLTQGELKYHEGSS